jgi:hypothetical protein
MAINDKNWEFLHTTTGLSLPYNDMYFRYLKGLGYKGVLQDMIGKSKRGINAFPNSGNPIAGGGVLGGFSALKQKLANGQNSVVFINADSTGYSDYGPFYLWAVAVGALYDATVTLHRWGEWNVGTGTAIGPKAYEAPVSLRTGAGPTLTVYLAALPGAVAGQMFAASRKPTAIDAIPTPDLSILHHGHNMQSYSVPYSAKYGIGAGLFLGGIGMTSLQWPGVPQVLTTQNPWRDPANPATTDLGYNKVYFAQQLAAAGYPSLTLVDTHAAFIAAGKPASLYRDILHPSDSSANSAGAQLVSAVLLSAFQSAKAGADAGTVAWPKIGGANVTLSLASPGVVNWPNHGRVAGDTVIFSTDGTLPAPPTAGNIYFVKTVLDTDRFTVSSTAAGAALNFTGVGTGAHKGGAGQLIENYDFGNWTGSVPVGWSVAGSVTTTKDTVNTYGGAPWACSITPNSAGSGQFQYLQKFCAQNSKELLLMSGKSLSIAMLAKPPPRRCDLS